MENTPSANWAEERATALLDNTGPRSQIHKNGHSSTVHGESTLKVAFTNPKGTRISQKGLRAELLEKHLIKSISEQIKAELNPEPPAPGLCSVTRSDYAAQGFRFVRPAPSADPHRTTTKQDRDYKTDQAITYWSENHQNIQGATAVKTRDDPFKKNATFSTPITECLDDPINFPLES